MPFNPTHHGVFETSPVTVGEVSFPLFFLERNFQQINYPIYSWNDFAWLWLVWNALARYNHICILYFVIFSESAYFILKNVDRKKTNGLKTEKKKYFRPVFCLKNVIYDIIKGQKSPSAPPCRFSENWKQITKGRSPCVN